MASVQDLYSGIIKPGGGMFEGTGGAGVYDGILPGATGAPSSGLISRSVKTLPIDPYTGQPIKPKAASTPLTQAQLQAIKAVPANSYQWPRNTPLNIPGQPYGSSFADTGNKGRASGAMTQELALAGLFGPSLPNVKVPDVPTAVASVPLPRVRPAGAPWSPEMEAALAADATLGDLLAYAQTLPETGALGAASELGKMYAPNPRSSGGGSSSGSSGGGSSAGQPVKISTGKTASVGQTYQQGASGSGKPYTYQVQKDGSIKNMTTGRTTAPATR